MKRHALWCRRVLPLLLAAAGGCDEAALYQPLAAGALPEQCVAGSERDCFDGPADRADVGACRSGKQRCAANGLQWGACEGQVTPTVEDCSTKADEDCDGVLTCGQTSWSLRFGTARDEIVAGVAFDADGNLLVTGYYRDSIDLGDGPLPVSNTSRDVYVAKLSPTGQPLWSRAIWGDSHLTARGLAVGPQGQVLVMASFSGAVTAQGAGAFASAGGSDALVVMYDHAGESVWGAAFGDAAEQHPMAAAFDAGGELWLAGLFTGAIDFGGEPLQASGGSYDGFVARLSGQGELRSSRLLAGSGDVVPRALAASSDGGVALVGDFRGELSAAGQTVVAVGDERDVMVAAFGPDGQPSWIRRWGDDAFDRAYGVATDAQDRILVVGRFEGSLPVAGTDLWAKGGGAGFVLALDAQGKEQWARQLGGEVDAGAYAVAVDPRGRPVVVGYYAGALSLGETVLPSSGVAEPAMVLTKLEPDGAFVYSRGVRVQGDQDAGGVVRAWRSVAVGPAGRTALVGYVSGVLDLGDGPSAPLGGVDALVALLEP